MPFLSSRGRVTSSALSGDAPSQVHGAFILASIERQDLSFRVTATQHCFRIRRSEEQLRRELSALGTFGGWSTRTTSFTK